MIDSFCVRRKVGSMKLSIQSEVDIFGMANLYPKHTGLPVIIWVDNVGCGRNVQHDLPRVKVQNVKGNRAVDDTFSLSISDSPEILAGQCKLSNRDLKCVKNFIIEHEAEFMQHWNQEIDEYELKDLLAVSK